MHQVLALADEVREVAVALDRVRLQVHVQEVVALVAHGVVDAASSPGRPRRRRTPWRS